MVDPLGLDGARPLDGSIAPIPKINPRPGGNVEETRSFAETLADTVSEVQRLQSEADTTINRVVAGEIKDVSEAMVALQEADNSFKTMMAVRGKVMDAYQEIMRMQI